MSTPTLQGPNAESVERTDVLVVGGSLIGLSTAMFLAWHGVRAVVVERRGRMGQHPRAWGYHPRTLEMLTEVGLLDAVNAAGPDTASYRDVLKVSTLAGKELGRYEPEHLQVSHRSFSDISPAPYSLCAQHRLEPILRTRAEELGADVRFGMELTEFSDDGDGVSAIVRDDLGVTRTIRASYLVAADGLKSSVRDALAIPTSGVRGMAHIMNILFEADLTPALRDRTFFLCHVEKPEGAVLNPVDEITGGPTDRWQLHVPFDPTQGQRSTDFTEERCVAAIRTAIGIPDLDARVVQALPWEVAGYSAEQYSRGRVFLVGDAAHVMPPAGAFGANTGIHDAHNLAWKLAAVLRGTAGRALLDSYDAERRPAAGFTVEQALLRAVHQFLGDPSIAEQIIDDRVIMFGIRYRSAAVPGATAGNDDLPYEGMRPVGTPGTRVPHVELDRGDTKLSTIDLVGRHMLLLAGPDGSDWCAAAEKAAIATGVDMVAHQVREAADTGISGNGTALRDVADRFAEATGAGRAGALLVRPDGVVAWRSAVAPPEDPSQRLVAALQQMLDQPSG